MRQYVEQGLNAEEISARFVADGLLRTHQAVRRYLQRLRDKEPGKWCAKVAPSPVTLADPVRVEGDCLGLFDAHAPAHDASWINRVIALARSWHIENCVLGGDIIDWQSLSPFGNETDISARQEIAATRQMVTAIKRSFAKIVEFEGNHERRINRATASRFQSDLVVNLWLDYNDNVTYSDYEWCEVVSGGELYRFVHPGNYSGHATVVAADLCDIYEVNTICGHDHVWGMARNKSGRYWAIDAGACCDGARMAYKQKRMTRHPQIQTGACIVRDGIPILLGPGNIAIYERMMA